MRFSEAKGSCRDAQRYHSSIHPEPPQLRKNQRLFDLLIACAVARVESRSWAGRCPAICEYRHLGIARFDFRSVVAEPVVKPSVKGREHGACRLRRVGRHSRHGHLLSVDGNPGDFFAVITSPLRFKNHALPIPTPARAIDVGTAGGVINPSESPCSTLLETSWSSFAK